MVGDNDLMVQFISTGDSSTLGPLVERHSDRLRAYLKKIILDFAQVEDILQDTWVRVMERKHHYNPKYLVKNWLFSVAINVAMNHLDQLKSRRTGSFTLVWKASMPSLIDETQHEPLDDMIREEEEEQLEQMVQLLPESDEETVALILQGLKFREAAEVRGESENTIKTRFYRSVRTLREKMIAA